MYCNSNRIYIANIEIAGMTQWRKAALLLIEYLCFETWMSGPIAKYSEIAIDTKCIDFLLPVISCYWHSVTKSANVLMYIINHYLSWWHCFIFEQLPFNIQNWSSLSLRHSPNALCVQYTCIDAYFIYFGMVIFKWVSSFKFRG